MENRRHWVVEKPVDKEKSLTAEYWNCWAARCALPGHLLIEITCFCDTITENLIRNPNNGQSVMLLNTRVEVFEAIVTPSSSCSLSKPQAVCGKVVEGGITPPNQSVNYEKSAEIKFSCSKYCRHQMTFLSILGHKECQWLQISRSILSKWLLIHVGSSICFIFEMHSDTKSRQQTEATWFLPASTNNFYNPASEVYLLIESPINLCNQSQAPSINSNGNGFVDRTIEVFSSHE